MKIYESYVAQKCRLFVFQRNTTAHAFPSVIIYSLPHILRESNSFPESGFKHGNDIARLITTALIDKVFMSYNVATLKVTLPAERGISSKPVLLHCSLSKVKI